MKKSLLLTLAAAAMVGLAACGQPASSSAPSASGFSSSSSSQAPAVFDGGISTLEVDVDADVNGVVTQILSQGFTLADGKAAVYCYGSDSVKNLKVGDYVNVTGNTTKYYGVFELAKITVTKLTDNVKTLADVITTETEITAAIATKFFDDVTECKAEGKDPYPTTSNVPYKFSNLTATKTSKGIAFKVGESERLLCPHYYMPQHNRTVANQGVQFYEGCKYDVHFYLMGTNSTNNIDIHVYDVEAHYDAVESVSAPETLEVEVNKTLAVTASVLPATADQALVYVPDDSGVYTVDNKGVVTGVAEGTGNLIVKSAADETKSATVAITVSAAAVEYESIGKLSFDHNANVTVEKGDKKITYTEGSISIEVAQGTSTSAVNEWKADYGSARWYKSHVVTITGSEAFAMVKLTCDTASDGQYVPSVDDASYGENIGLGVLGDGIVEFDVDANAASMVLTMAKQIRVVDVELFKIK